MDKENKDKVEREVFIELTENHPRYLITVSKEINIDGYEHTNEYITPGVILATSSIISLLSLRNGYQVLTEPPLHNMHQIAENFYYSYSPKTAASVFLLSNLILGTIKYLYNYDSQRNVLLEKFNMEISIQSTNLEKDFPCLIDWKQRFEVEHNSKVIVKHICETTNSDHSKTQMLDYVAWLNDKNDPVLVDMDLSIDYVPTQINTVDEL